MVNLDEKWRRNFEDQRPDMQGSRDQDHDLRLGPGLHRGLRPAPDHHQLPRPSLLAEGHLEVHLLLPTT